MIQFGGCVIGDAERENVLRVLESGRLTRGQVCEEFEEELTRLTGYGCHAVSSGTAALHVALLAAGVKPGDRVVVPATTYVATANAVLYCGAEPIVVDVDRQTWTIDYEQAVTAAEDYDAAAIVPVHLYGAPAPSFHGWRDNFYRRTGRMVRIVEDAAESLGCLRDGEHPCGDLATLSFFGSKTLTTGEGGAVLWRDSLLGDRVIHLAGQAMTKQRYLHDACGWNYRMTELAAAVGLAQLGRLPNLLERRRQVFRWYDEFLPPSFGRQGVEKEDSHGYWAFAVAHPYGPPVDAAKVVHDLAMAGVEARPIFPPLTSHRHLGSAEAPFGTPIADRLHACGIVLPTHPLLTQEQVLRVSDLLKVLVCGQ